MAVCLSQKNAADLVVDDALVSVQKNVDVKLTVGMEVVMLFEQALD